MDDNFINELKKTANASIAKIEAASKAFTVDIIDALNKALATEIVCMLRYRRHYYVIYGLTSKDIGEELLTHSNEEQQHIDWIAERIIQLGGTPDFNPASLLDRSDSQYTAGGDTPTILNENLEAEMIAIAVYKGMILWIGEFDPTTRIMLEKILKIEEEHADDLRTLLGLRQYGSNNRNYYRMWIVSFILSYLASCVTSFWGVNKIK